MLSHAELRERVMSELRGDERNVQMGMGVESED